MNPSQFKSQNRWGFASAARYSVNLFGMNLHPESITLPSKSVSVFTHSLFGPIVQYPYRETFNDNIVMTLPEDAFGETRWSMEFDMYQTENGGANPGSIDTQTVNLTISQDDLSDKPIGTYSVYGAYIVSIVPTNMGYGMQNETAKVQVMFKYYKYTYA